MMITRCRNCNAEVTGLVCNECGTYVATNRDKESELTMLEEYHRTLQEVTDPQAIVSILENGFLPQQPEALIEAGFRCLPLIKSGDLSKSNVASRRLETIISKLKVTSSAKLTSQAIAEFELKLKEVETKQKEREAKSNADGNQFIGCILMFLAVGTGSCAYWFWG